MRDPVLTEIQKIGLSHGEKDPVELTKGAVLGAAVERTGLEDFGVNDRVESFEERLALWLSEVYEGPGRTAEGSGSTCIDGLQERTRDLDVGLVVSNAGYNPVGSFEERTPEELCRILDVNCKAPLLLAHVFRPRLQARGQGGFLMTGSVEGFFGVPYSAAYSATKNFVLAFGEALWAEHADTDVDVRVLAPGATDTEIIRARNMRNLPGIMQPSEVAEYGLDQLRHGPIAVPGAANKEMVAAFAGMPRTDAVVAMGRGMKAAMQGKLRSQ